MPPEALKILAQCFPQMEPCDLAELTAVAQLHTYPGETVLCREGALEDTFYIIISGGVTVTKRLTDDAELQLKWFGAGNFFGEVALIQESVRTATVTTTTETTVLEIQREPFIRVLESNGRLAVRIMSQITHHLRDADTRTIAGLREKNQALARAYAELARQERLRSEFLTTISHELRTPLTSAIGYLQFVGSGDLTALQREHFLGIVERNLKTITHLVNNILFLQEMELVTPKFEPLNVAALTAQTIQAHSAHAAQSGLSIRPQIAKHIPTLMGDSASLGRAIDALLDNAIKFSPAGGEITVAVQARNGHLHIRISDPGIGFPLELREELFKPFRRIESAEGELFGGIGVGLPIAQHAVELHGGRIDVHSQPQHGSTFEIVLPVEQVTG